jgi:hypothetical protein
MINLEGPIMDKYENTGNQCFMEPTVRKEVVEFMDACKTLARFAHLNNGLTDQEREMVFNVSRAFEPEVAHLPLTVDEEILWIKLFPTCY